MKKIVSLLVIITISFSFTACVKKRVVHKPVVKKKVVVVKPKPIVNKRTIIIK